MLSNRVEFPVGDYSDDGHGRVSNYYIDTNKTIDELVIIHNKSKEVLGFDIGDIADEYQDAFIKSDIINQMDKAGFDWKSCLDYDAERDDEISDVDVGDYEVFIIWVKLLQFIDPSFEYEVVSLEDLQSFAWQNCGLPGYGCFE